MQVVPKRRIGQTCDVLDSNIGNLYNIFKWCTYSLISSCCWNYRTALSFKLTLWIQISHQTRRWVLVGLNWFNSVYSFVCTSHMHTFSATRFLSSCDGDRCREHGLYSQQTRNGRLSTHLSTSSQFNPTCFGP